ncbi:MAG: AAA family ATPase [Firmicutes bacterium]|nr:AAA family ATPase [Bacillota bacterium]
MQLKIDKNKIILSNHAIKKTEKMAFLVSSLLEADSTLLKIAESLIKAKLKTGNYQIKSTHQKIYVQIDNEKQAIVFFDFEYPDAFIKKGDTRLKNLTEFELEPSDKTIDNEQNKKLYRIIKTKNYFPILDQVQKEIVATEDKNMIVHGVAGSGKTNICIDKIIYSSGRGYRGRLLYTTYSKSLLNDTKLKILEYIGALNEFIDEFDNIEFFCDNKGAAIEHRLGVYLSLDEDSPLDSLKKIVVFLTTQVDYCLIEDLYGDARLANESYFIKEYLPQIKNHNLAARLKQINHISHEIIYKEIYGLILGSEKVLNENEYIDKRKDSFNRIDCQTIYALSQDYNNHLKQARMTDYNQMCRDMMDKSGHKYSLVLIDEVQDYTQINLAFFKSISLKMFCVGDALQMINPSYFSFSYLKRLLYQKDISLIKELVSNYRSSQKIAEILKSLSDLNSKSFGVHNFVLFSSSIASSENTETVLTQDLKFLNNLNNSPFNNYTIITPNQKTKDDLRKKFHRQEILTVSESKGLERDIVILYDILSAQNNEWQAFIKRGVDKKSADENSVYRYYFNLLYVAVSRAKQKLYIIESAPPKLFDQFFKNHFDNLTNNDALDKLLKGVDKLEAEQDEVIKRSGEFIKLGQYENALFWAQQIIDKNDKARQLTRIDAAKAGDYRSGGIRFMKEGMYEDALEYFLLANEDGLANLAKSCMGIGDGDSGMEAIKCFLDLDGNKEARDVILEILKHDLRKIKEWTIK